MRKVAMASLLSVLVILLGCSETKLSIEECESISSNAISEERIAKLSEQTIKDVKIEMVVEQEKQTLDTKSASEEESISYTHYDVPYSSGMKSYMPFSVNGNSIFSESSNQYKLQELCHTGNYGIRQYEERYCVAIGSYFNTSIGQYFDLVLENGVIIPCVMADQKADCHTDENNIITVANGCMTEFVVDSAVLNNDAKIMGDISYCTEEWKARVVEVRIYEENVFS